MEGVKDQASARPARALTAWRSFSTPFRVLIEPRGATHDITSQQFKHGHRPIQRVMPGRDSSRWGSKALGHGPRTGGGEKQGTNKGSSSAKYAKVRAEPSEQMPIVSSHEQAEDVEVGRSRGRRRKQSAPTTCSSLRKAIGYVIIGLGTIVIASVLIAIGTSEEEPEGSTTIVPIDPAPPLAGVASMEQPSRAPTGLQLHRSPYPESVTSGEQVRSTSSPPAPAHQLSSLARSAPRPPPAPCNMWCIEHPLPWESKCQEFKYCRDAINATCRRRRLSTHRPPLHH